MQPAPTTRDVLAPRCFKVMVLGDIGTGKSSTMKRLVRNLFSDNYKATIGVDFALWIASAGRIQLWDLSGNERHGSMTRVYYTGAAAAVLLCDATRPYTFEGVKKWKIDFCGKTDGDAPTLLLANKWDLVPATERDRTRLAIETLGMEIGVFDTVFVSCKTREGIETAGEALCRMLETVPEKSTPWEDPNQRSKVREDETTFVSDATENPTAVVSDPTIAALPEASEWQFLIWKELVADAVRAHWTSFGVLAAQDKLGKAFRRDPNLIVNLPYVHAASDEQVQKLARVAVDSIPTETCEIVTGVKPNLVTATRLFRPSGSPPSPQGLTWFHFSREDSQT